MNQREIKFRAWSEHEKIMYMPDYTEEEDFYITCDGEVKFLSETGMYERHIPKEYRKDWHLMQYTGLKDKNGKEIYEGDIITYWNGTMNLDPNGEHMHNGYNYSIAPHISSKVVFEQASFRIENGNPLGSRYIQPHEIEVIGNIYEHPELLSENAMVSPAKTPEA
jgi:uncharacterized phage protein (TIGR01671 family)